MKFSNRKSKQLSFWNAQSNSHGGDLRVGLRKIARPLATKRPIHVVLKSAKARGEWNLLKREKAIIAATQSCAKRFRVKVYRQQNVGNHLHLAIQAKRRIEIQNFLRVLPQAIAFVVTGAKKGNAKGPFWTSPAFTRVVEWGRDWIAVNNYHEKNRLEAEGTPRDVVELLWREVLS